MNHTIGDITSLLKQLDDARIHYRLSSLRSDAIAVEVAVPGERWEIEFLDDGSIEVERFISNGKIESENTLEDLFSRFSD